jgi:hypothetical protein
MVNQLLGQVVDPVSIRANWQERDVTFTPIKSNSDVHNKVLFGAVVDTSERALAMIHVAREASLTTLQPPNGIPDGY